MNNKNNSKNFSPEFILSIVRDNPEAIKNYRFIVMGKTGPTGKTWLTEQLRSIGCDAIELSEDICGYVDYKDSKNHYLIDPFNKNTVIILNAPLCHPFNWKEDIKYGIS